MTSLLEVEGLAAGYDDALILRGVSLEAAAEKIVAIVGPNGAGKTTLFKAISGTVEPAAGKIEFEGRDLLAVPPPERAHLGIAHVPEGRQVFASLTVLENLEMGAYAVRGRADWHIPQDAFVVLHVGSTVDRKNVPLVIDIVARLRNDADTYLLQVGGKFSGEQEQLIDRLRLRGAVRSLRSADEAVLRRAYRAADVLLFPSLYEGFGFPVLEAFASELPVVASGAGGLKEVAGDAAVIVEGRDPATYVEAIEDLSSDSDGS